jgi:phosphoribosylglycinamide formyltransferase-1
LLPLFKGKDGIKESFHSGMKVGGVTVHRVDETLDGGEILAQGCVPILAEDTEQSYRERVHALEYTLYPQTIERMLLG